MSEIEPRKVRADAADRAQRAAELRVAGSTWASIASEVGFAHDGSARRAVRSYLGSLPEPDRLESRQLLRERAEHLWSQAAVDVAEQKPGALRAAIALLQRQSLLDGLDEPTRVYTSPTPERMEAVIELLVRARQEELGVVTCTICATPLSPWRPRAGRPWRS